MEVMVEHFRRFVKDRIGGRTKPMGIGQQQEVRPFGAQHARWMRLIGLRYFVPA
jgi:hypothetical protein